MKRKALAFGAGLMLAASMAVPASADTSDFCSSSALACETYCYGTRDTAGVCVSAAGRTVREDCVWVGLGRCVPVEVPAPTYSCWSAVASEVCTEMRDPVPSL